MRSAEARRARRAHRGDRPADRPRARAGRANRADRDADGGRTTAAPSRSAWRVAASGRRRTRACGRRPCSSVDVVYRRRAAPGAGRSPARRTATSPAMLEARAPATATGSARRRALRPDPASRYQPDGPHGPSAIVDPAAFRWTDSGWRGVRRDGQVIYEMHVGTFTPRRHLARRGRAARRARRSRHHRHRDDAGRRLRRPLRLGLRRRQPVRADAPLRHARRSARVRRSRARARPRRDPRRRLQPRRPRRELPRRISRPTTSPTATRTTGARRSTSKRPAPARAFFVENAALLDRRVPFRRPAARRDAGHPRRVAGTCRRRADPAPRAQRPARVPIFVVAENEPQDTDARPRSGDGRPRRRRALERRLSSHRARGADRKARGLLPRLQGLGAGVHLGAPSTATSIRGSGTAGRSSAAARPALDLPPHAFVSYLENHDQVANTPFGRRLHQVRSPGAPARADRADCCSVRRRRCCSRGRSSRRRRRSSISRTTSRSWRRRSRRTAGVPVAVSERDRSRRPRGAAVPGRRGDVRALQARSRASASAMPRLVRAAPRSDRAAPHAIR